MTRIWRSLACATLAVTVTACSSSSSAPTAPATAQAPQISPATLTGLNNPDATLFAFGSAGTPAASPCAHNPATGQFSCQGQGGMHDGITFTVRHTYYDASGNIQPAFDAQTTAAVKTETTASGTSSYGGMTMTVDRTGVMMATGLGPNATTHTLNSTEQGTMSATMSNNGASGTMQSTMSATTTNLVVPVGRIAGPMLYPGPGTRLHSSTMTSTVNGQNRTTSMTRRETYDGSSIVRVEMTVNGVTEQCTVDLAARTSTCSSR